MLRAIILTCAFASVAASAQTPSPSLRIVVLAGEDAVNVVQQKTAVTPLVEVRDGGGPSALAFSATESGTGANQNASMNYSFTGSLSGNTITGTLSWQTQSQTSAGNQTFTGTGGFTIPVTLQR